VIKTRLKTCPCTANPVETAVRLSSGWAHVCRPCAAYIASCGDDSPGVVLDAPAARLAFDRAFGNGSAGVTIADAYAIAFAVEHAVRQAGIAAAVARKLVRDPRRGMAPEPAHA
jgi:hypothetical protein